jgi:hypothetical protein
VRGTPAQCVGADPSRNRLVILGGCVILNEVMDRVRQKLTVIRFLPLLGLLALTRSWADCEQPISGAPFDPNQAALFQIPKAMPKSLPQYQRYLEDTYEGLELLRGKNGLIQDSADVLDDKKHHPFQLQITKTDTSPTNIGVDLLVQATMADRGEHKEHAMQVMAKILATLENEPSYVDPVTHKKTGLFYSWYESHGLGATNENVSAVDNIHMALALWTLKEKFPDSPVGDKARELFDKMDFSAFYDKTNGLIHGNITHDPTKAPAWTVDAYDYEYFGAEARSIYAVGYALGLFKEQRQDPDFVTKAVKNLAMERYPTKLGDILKTWDGGGFQVLLPETLLNEDAYSSALHESASAYGPFILDQGKKLGLTIPGNKKHFFPAGFSADPQGRDKNGNLVYAAQAGNGPLVASPHLDYCDPEKRKTWSSAITVHVIMMAASIDAAHSDEFSQSFSDLERYKYKGVRLYHPGLGFSDGVKVDKGHDYGTVVSQDSAVDQLFFMTGAIRATDTKGYGLSANTLQNDSSVRNGLNRFYGPVDQKLELTVPSTQPVQCPK